MLLKLFSVLEADAKTTVLFFVVAGAGIKAIQLSCPTFFQRDRSVDFIESAVLEGKFLAV
jgi:hypothetical protein